MKSTENLVHSLDVVRGGHVPSAGVLVTRHVLGDKPRLQHLNHFEVEGEFTAASNLQLSVQVQQAQLVVVVSAVEVGHRKSLFFGSFVAGLQSPSGPGIVLNASVLAIIES